MLSWQCYLVAFLVWQVSKSLRVKVIFLSILLASYVIGSGALDCSGVLIVSHNHHTHIYPLYYINIYISYTRNGTERPNSQKRRGYV